MTEWFDLPVQETWVRSLGLEDPLEKEMATYSSVLAWKVPGTEEPSGLHSPWGHKELDITEHTHEPFILFWSLVKLYIYTYTHTHTHIYLVSFFNQYVLEIVLSSPSTSLFFSEIAWVIPSYQHYLAGVFFQIHLTSY